MTVKLVLLKSGEDIITDLQEMVIPVKNQEEIEEKVVGYFFNKPCIISMKSPEIIVETDDMPAQNKIEIKLSPWIPLSKSAKVPVPPDWVVTIVDPIDKVKEMYENQVLETEKNETNQDISIDQQSDSDQSD
jgi:hypothetical protein